MMRLHTLLELKSLQSMRTVGAFASAARPSMARYRPILRWQSQPARVQSSTTSVRIAVETAARIAQNAVKQGTKALRFSLLDRLTKSDAITSAERELLVHRLDERTAGGHEDGAASLDEAIHHPLGGLIADLGYKHIYSPNLNALGAIPVWEKQRVFRPERSKSMANDMINARKRPGAADEPMRLAGVISVAAELCEDGTTEYRVIDGQHRIGALEILAAKGEWDGASQPRSPLARRARAPDPSSRPPRACAASKARIVTEVYHVSGASANETMVEIFTDINKCEPVQLIDIPGLVDAQQHAALAFAVESLRAKFKPMFKPTKACRAPHLNVDLLRQELYDANVLVRHCDIEALGKGDEQAGDALLRWLLAANDTLASRSDDEWRESHKGSKAAFTKALQKARENGLYLGLEKSWLFS